MRLDDMFDIARRAAEFESVSSQLPGRENGPADAYRHILWVAEMTRRFGENAARNIAGLNEDLSELEEEERQFAEQAMAMDLSNNAIGIQIGRNAKTWDEVVQAARRVIEQSPGDGTGKRNDQSIGAKWLEPSKWSKNPIITEEFTGEKIEAPTNHPKVNWTTGPDKKLDWKGKRVQEPFIYRFGGEDFRHSSNRRKRSDAQDNRPRSTQSADTDQQDRDQQISNARSETSGTLGDSMLVNPKNLSLENKDRMRARLGFHAEEAERDPGKRAKVAKCMVDCFVREPGFDGLSDGLDRQLGGIAATMSPSTALAVLRDEVPEAAKPEPPRRRRAGPAPLDQSGRAAVRQAVLRHGAAPLQAGIARGAAKKAVDRIGGRDMMARELPGVFGAAFAPVGGADKPMRAAAKAANAINEAAGAPERVDSADASGREIATAIERAIQAAGPEKFMARLDEDPDFGLGGFAGGGSRRAGRSLLDA